MYEMVKFLLKLLLKGTVQLRDTAKVYVWLLQKHLYFLPHTHKPHKKNENGVAYHQKHTMVSLGIDDTSWPWLWSVWG